MDTDDADAEGADGVAASVGLFGVEMTFNAEWEVVLRDLIALHEVGVWVVLAVELGEGGDRAVESEAGKEGLADGFGVDDRECAGHSETDRADVGIWLGVSDVGATAAEHFALCKELGVYFQADGGQVFGHTGVGGNLLRAFMGSGRRIIACFFDTDHAGKYSLGRPILIISRRVQACNRRGIRYRRSENDGRLLPTDR
jgi:hypothetical protein